MPATRTSRHSLTASVSNTGRPYPRPNSTRPAPLESVHEAQAPQGELEEMAMWPEVQPSPTRLGLKKLKLEDLECVKTLGRGAFGKVLAVRTRSVPQMPEDELWGSHDTQFALKAITKTDIRQWEQERVDMENVRAYRNNERRILSMLPWNPFVNGMVDAFVDERNLYYLLEFAPCGNFHSYIRKHHPLPMNDAKFYFANIVIALEFLQSQGIIHRDLKPGNILMNADGYLCIGDFGGSIHVDDDPATVEWRAGTTPYMCPEVLKGKDPVGAARMVVDWWSAAICLYEMVSKKVPFNGSTKRIRAKIRSGRIMWYNKVEWDPELQDLLKRMLAVRPEDRYGTLLSKAEPGKVALNYELRTHGWLNNIPWRKIEQRLQVAPYVPASHPDITMGMFAHGMPPKWSIPGLPRIPYQAHRIDPDRAKGNKH